MVSPGSKAAFLDDLGWLTSLAPVVFSFRNSPDGYKLLFGDGIYCEFAVFEPHELASVIYSEGTRIDCLCQRS